MRFPARRSRPACWPFWALLAAWCFANTPPPAIFAGLNWLAEARRFSHQHRLTDDVARILVGEKSPRSSAVVASGPAEKSPLPALPAEAGWKRLDLCMETQTPAGAVSTRAHAARATNERTVESWRAQPPHEPPRGVVS